MDFSLDADVQDLVELTEELCRNLLTAEYLATQDTACGPGSEDGAGDPDRLHLDRELWDALVSAGVPEAIAPEAAGGGGLGIEAAVAVQHVLGRYLAQVPLDTAVVAAELLVAAGDGERAAAVARGSMIAAVPDVLTGAAAAAGGALAAVPWAPAASVLVVPAGDAVRVVPLPTDGVSVDALVPVDYSCAGRVALSTDTGEQVVVGSTVVERAELYGRLLLCAYQWGVLDEALRSTASYAAERKQFGRPIGTFQAVSARLADGLIDVDAVRLATLRAASELDAAAEPSDAARSAVGIAHFWACEAGHRIAHSTVHIHGGTGLDRENTSHRYFLAAKAAEFRRGGAHVQLAALGAQLVAAGDPWEEL